MEKVVGNALRKEREARGVSLADIAGETRIGTRFLQALEDEDFDVFPGTFYVHYYIKNYLRACGADEAAFFNTYDPYLKAALKKGDELSPREYMHKMAYAKFRRSRRILTAFLSIVGLAIPAYLLLGPPRLLQRFSGPANGVKVSLPPFSALLLRPGEESCPAVPPVIAHMEFDAPCWLQLWRGDQKLVERTFRPGDVQRLHGYRLTLVIANPPALRLRLNDRDVSFFRSTNTALRMVVDPVRLQEILGR